MRIAVDLAVYQGYTQCALLAPDAFHICRKEPLLSGQCGQEQSGSSTSATVPEGSTTASRSLTCNVAARAGSRNPRCTYPAAPSTSPPGSNIGACWTAWSARQSRTKT